MAGSSGGSSSSGGGGGGGGGGSRVRGAGVGGQKRGGGRRRGLQRRAPVAVVSRRGVGSLVLPPGQAALTTELQHPLHVLDLVAHGGVLAPALGQRARGGRRGVAVATGSDAAAGLGHQQVVEDVQDGVDVPARLPTPVLEAGI